MSRQSSKNIVSHFVEHLFKEHDVQAIDQWVDPKVIAHIPHLPSRIVGLEEYRRFIDGLYHAFQNARTEVEDVIAEDNRVTIRWNIRGVCKDDLMCPLANQGNTTLHLISIFRLSNDRIVEYWQMDTAFSLMPDF